MKPEFELPETIEITPVNDFSGISDLDGSLPFIITLGVPDTAAATAANYLTAYTLPFPCVLLDAWEVHKTAGSNGSPVTLDVEKLTSGTAPGSGVSAVDSTFDLKGTASTPQHINGSATPANATFARGDSVTLKPAGTLTAVNSVGVTLVFSVLMKYLPV